MDKSKAAADMLAQAARLAPFEGWNDRMLSQAAVAAGYKKTDAIRVFPGGAVEAIEALLSHFDDEMQRGLAAYSLETMKIRQRIATILRVRFQAMAGDREAVRRAMAVLAQPLYAHRALGRLYRTVDTVWRAAGDTSTDFNFYTKRLMLAGVYSSTLLYWLNDRSPDCAATWEFLDRRIDNVMAIERAKHKVKAWLRPAA